MPLFPAPKGLVTFRQDRCNLGLVLSCALVFINKEARFSRLPMRGT
jgi:hypothetical protein